MVELQSDQNSHLLILTPNSSMSWETNKKILIAVFCVNMSIASVWAYMGAWLVLPFAGLEVLLVGVGMYYVCWKLNFKHVIRIEAESLTLQKGVYFPKQEWQWQTSQTSLLKQPSNHRMSAPKLFLKHLNQSIEIGDFLNRSDKVTVREHLRDLGVPVTVVKSQ